MSFDLHVPHYCIKKESHFHSFSKFTPESELK